VGADRHRFSFACTYGYTAISIVAECIEADGTNRVLMQTTSTPAVERGLLIRVLKHLEIFMVQTGMFDWRRHRLGLQLTCPDKTVKI
jgi:hypothetical protein